MNNGETRMYSNRVSGKNRQKQKIIFIIIGALVILILLGGIFLLLRPDDEIEYVEEKEKPEMVYTKEVKSAIDVNRNGKKLPISLSSKKVGQVTCITDDCYESSAYNQYAIVADGDAYYVYDYRTDTMVAGPLGAIVNLESNSNKNYLRVCHDGTTLLSIIAIKNDKADLYDVNTNSLYRNILLDSDLTINDNVYADEKSSYIDQLAHYGFAGFVYSKYDADGDDDHIDTIIKLFSINDGKVIYKFNNFNNALTINNNLYIVKQDIVTNKYTMYDLSNNQLLNKEEFNYLNLKNNQLLLFNDQEFEIYDNTLNLVKKSKKYNKVLAIDNGYALVVNAKNIDLVDLNETLLKTIVTDYDAKRYVFDNASWKLHNNVNGIDIILTDNNLNLDTILASNPNFDKSKLPPYGVEYFYNPTSKQLTKTYVSIDV